MIIVFLFSFAEPLEIRIMRVNTKYVKSVIRNLNIRYEDLAKEQKDIIEKNETEIREGRRVTRSHAQTESKTGM